MSIEFVDNVVTWRDVTHVGYEVSGVVDELCTSVDDSHVKVGDHVIVYPTDEDEESTDDG